MMGEKMQRKVINAGADVLLALLYAPGSSGRIGEPIKGFTRLEKMMYLISKETTVKDVKDIIERDYHFEPDNFGPCAGEIYDDTEMLRDGKIIETTTVETDNLIESADIGCVQDAEAEEESSPEPTKEAEVFQLSQKGLRIGEIIFSALPEESRRRISVIKTLYNDKPVMDLVRFVYAKFPEATVRSKIRHVVS